jgi:hypothetical protein
MKKFVQTAVLVAGLAGLSACATDDVWTPYGSRTAGEAEMSMYDMEGTTSAPAMVNDGSLAMCQERARRLEDMNRSCYRK